MSSIRYYSHHLHFRFIPSKQNLLLKILFKDVHHTVKHFYFFSIVTGSYVCRLTSILGVHIDIGLGKPEGGRKRMCVNSWHLLAQHSFSVFKGMTVALEIKMMAMKTRNLFTT